MRRLDWYITKEMFVPFLIGTLVVVMMFQINGYIWLAKSFNVENIPLAARFQWILFMTPSWLKMTLPVGMSLAASLAMTRLARESELTAIRAAGTRIMRVILPIGAFGVVVAIGNFYIVDQVIPRSMKRANDIAQKNMFLGLTSEFKSNAFLQLDRYAASFGNVQRRGETNLLINDILLIERSGGSVVTLISAKQGSYNRGIWQFPDAMRFTVDGIEIDTAHAEMITVSQDINFDELFKGSMGLSTEESPTSELRKNIAAAIKSKGNPRPWEIELQQRYAVPATCAIFALTSPIFAVYFAKGGGFVGVLVSFVIVLLYFNVYVISGQILGKQEAVPPWLAAWLPNIIFGCFAIVGIRRLE